jgi:hypothetical protein
MNTFFAFTRIMMGEEAHINGCVRQKAEPTKFKKCSLYSPEFTLPKGIANSTTLDEPLSTIQL